MKPIIFKGCGTALATPFDENGINFKVFEEMLENRIENGVDALIVCGTTCESSTMTEKERKDGNAQRRRGKTFGKITRIRARRTCRRKTSRERKTGTRTES